MKTTISITALVIGLGLGLNAQTTAQKNTCIKIDINENGKETKIDTCFNMAIGDSIKKMFMNIHWDSINKKFAEISKQMGGSNIEIDSSTSPDGKKEIIKITTDKNGKDNVITITGDDGKNNSASAYTYSSGGNGQITVTSGNGNGNSIIISEEDGDLKDSKGNTYKVHVLKKVEIIEITDADKKELPSDVSSTLNSSKPFSSLVMAPNPTDGNVRITYKSTSTEPLQIKVYDTFGKTVLTQSYDGLDSDVDKTISLNNLSKGIYFVQLVQGTQADVRKIVVK